MLVPKYHFTLKYNFSDKNLQKGRKKLFFSVLLGFMKKMGG